MKHNFSKLKPYTVDGVPGNFLIRRLFVSEITLVGELVKKDPVHGMASAIATALIDADTGKPVFASPQEVLESLDHIQLSTIGGDISSHSHGLPSRSEAEAGKAADAAPGEAPPES